MDAITIKILSHVCKRILNLITDLSYRKKIEVVRVSSRCLLGAYWFPRKNICTRMSKGSAVR